MISETVQNHALTIVPITQSAAKRFIGRHHRHNLPSISSVFQIALSMNDQIVGVAMAGLPKARHLMDRKTLEVTRVCTLGHRNANSMLYGACIRVAKHLGWKRLVTYTLESESGSSLRAAGWRRDPERRNHKPDGWKTNGKGLYDLFGDLRMPDEPKVRWWWP